MNGIDVSKYQQKVDWSKVDASGVDFTLNRIGMGNVLSQKDPYFDNNVVQALAHGMFVGGYYFSYATSIADAQKEADICNEILQPYKGKLAFPVAYDYEYDSIKYFTKTQGRVPANAEIDSFAQTFLDRMKSYGWFVNIYTNIDFIRSGKFSTNTISKYDVWLADYNGAPDYPCGIQQTGSTGQVPGISGNVDMDVSFKDYPTIIKSGGYNGYPKQPTTAVQIDTTMDVSKPHGQYYIVKTTSVQPVTMTFGTSGVATIVPLPRNVNEQLFAIVAVGQVGQETGIYTTVAGETPTKRFKFKIN